jgi:AraC-like DNA-binding protein
VTTFQVNGIFKPNRVRFSTHAKSKYGLRLEPRTRLVDESDRVSLLLQTRERVADHLGISLRSLQAGFRQWRETTPTAFLRQARLQLVRDDLLRSGPEANVTTVALRHGFSHLGRFSAQYRSAFGEDPSATLRRGRAALARR